MDERVLELISKIRNKYLSDDTVLRPFDFSKFSQYFTLDVLTHIGFGTPFGFVSEEKDLYSYIETAANILPVMTLMGAFPPVMAVMQSSWVHALAGPTTKDKKGIGKLMA